jgi:hypothetical protein
LQFELADQRRKSKRNTLTIGEFGCGVRRHEWSWSMLE